MYRDRQYSYDAFIETFTEKGEFENGLIYVQIKATERCRLSKKHKGLVLDLEKRDLDLWANEIFPVIIVLYDANSDSGYFVNLHQYFKENRLQLKEINKYKRIFIPAENLLTKESIFNLQTVKNAIYEIRRSI